MSPVPSLPVTTKGVVLNLCLMMFIGISIQINTTTSSDNIISSYHQMLLLLVTHMSPLTFFGCVLSTAVPVVVLLVAAAYRGDSCSLTSARGGLGMEWLHTSRCCWYRPYTERRLSARTWSRWGPGLDS